MKKKALNCLLAMSLCLIASIAWAGTAVDYEDANCMGAWGMESSDSETDLSGEGGTLTESSGDDIPVSADKKFGDYSRDFELDDADFLEHADGNSTDISGADQPISICVWFKYEGEITTSPRIIGKWYSSGNNRQYALYLRDANGDALSARLSQDGTDSDQAYGATAVDDNAWHHGALVYNDIDIRIYVDGSLDSNDVNNPKAHTTGIADTSSKFYVGGDQDTNYFDGLIDDVGIFDRALDSTEINDIMDNGLAPSAPTTVNHVFNNMVIQGGFVAQ